MPKDDPTLFEELKVYDNPEAFKDPALEGTYRLSLPLKDSTDFPLPVVVTVEIDGAKLTEASSQYFSWVIAQIPDQDLARAGVRTADEFKAMMLTDPKFNDAKRAYFWFFVRYFPELVNKLVLTLGVLSFDSLATHGFVESEQQRVQLEQKIKGTVEMALTGFRRDFKRMLRTRTRGRPKKLIDPHTAPAIVNIVSVMAADLMEGKSGKDALPALKTIADKLNTTENALGKQLRGAGYSWTQIKEYLLTRHPPENQTEYSAAP